MFKENNNHEQKRMFTMEDQMDERLKNKLANHWSGMFYEKIFTGIDETIFKPLYSKHFGRGNFPVNILVGLEILKELNTLSDEQLLAAYHFDLSYRRALGLYDINEHILAPRTLYYFRSSMAEYEMKTGEDLMMKVFSGDRNRIIQELGLKTGLQRADTVMIGANIKRMNRLTLFHKVLSNLVKGIEVLGIHIDESIRKIVEDDEDGFAYRLKKDEYLSKTREIGGYIYLLVETHAENWEVNAGKSYQDAKRLLAEQCVITEGKVKLKEPDELSSSSMQNPADPDATYRKKRDKEHRGYEALGVETCDGDNKMQVIMDVDIAPNNIDDAKMLEGKIEEYKEDSGLDTIIVDGGCINDEVRKECAENEVRLVSSAIRGKKPKEESLTTRDFKINEKTGEILACPEGHRPQSQKIKGNTIIANIKPSICRKCRQKEKCPAYISRNQSRIIIDDKRRWLDERRALLDTAEYRALCNVRPPVEGLMEKIKPKYLGGRILFRGLKKVKARIILRAIGINFKRYRACTLDFITDFLMIFRLVGRILSYHNFCALKFRLAA